MDELERGYKHGTRYEPSAIARQFAKAQFDMYQALRQEGFNESQALQIIGATLAASMIAPRNDDDG